MFNNCNIKRIEHFESIFDELRNSFIKDPKSFFENEDMQNKLHLLTEYYESPLWMEDYERDERRELPSDLKRGVLSEDGVFNLLERIKEYKETAGE